jgi:hypothetical protein
MRFDKGLKLLCVAALSVLGACATSSINQEEMNKVKKVAIVGFNEYRSVAATVSYDLGSGKLGADKMGSVIPERSKETDQMLADLNRGLAAKKGWKMLDTATMKKNQTYIESWKATMEGWQNKHPTSPSLKKFEVEGVMDTEGVRLLRPAGTNKLIAALGVDAVAVIEVKTLLSSTTVMGIGQRRPFSQVLIRIFSPGSEGPIWFQTFTSEVSTESVGATAFIDEKKLATLSIATLRDAISKIQ